MFQVRNMQVARVNCLDTLPAFALPDEDEGIEQQVWPHAPAVSSTPLGKHWQGPTPARSTSKIDKKVLKAEFWDGRDRMVG